MRSGSKRLRARQAGADRFWQYSRGAEEKFSLRLWMRMRNVRASHASELLE
jgi:hypothetical protein